MTEPTRTSTGVAYLTYDASLNTDASMIIQQKLDLSGNTIAQTFCENAFNLAAERDISGSLLTDNDITDFTNNLVYLGSNDLNVQKTYLSANENSSKTQLLSINAYKMTLGKNIQIPLVSKLKLPPTVSNIYEYSEYSTKYPRPSYDYPANTDYAIQRFEIGNVYEIKNIPYSSSTQLSVRGNDIDGFSCIDNFSYTARYAGLISESDVSKNLFIQILGPTTEWPTGETKNGVMSTTLSNSSSSYQEHLTSGYKFIDRYVIPEVYEVSFYIRSFINRPRLSALLFYDSSHNVIPTVEIEKTPNNIDGTPNILSFPTSTPSLSFENLIDYSIAANSQWRPSKGSGAPRTESVDGTLKIKLWRQPVYYKYVTSYSVVIFENTLM